MKKLVLALVFVSFSAVSFAGDCPWTVRKAVKDKSDALRKCGNPDFVTNQGSFQYGPYTKSKEAWVYRNDDGTTTTITFRGDRREDFDQR